MSRRRRRPVFGVDSPEIIRHRLVRLSPGIDRKIREDAPPVIVWECSCGLVFAEDDDFRDPYCPNCDADKAEEFNTTARPSRLGRSA